jgi:hypothetical protein
MIGYEPPATLFLEARRKTMKRAVVKISLRRWIAVSTLLNAKERISLVSSFAPLLRRRA